jgi:hypothetical protein
MINSIPVFILMQEYCHFIAVFDFPNKIHGAITHTHTYTHIHTCGDVIVVERVFISLKAFFSVCVFFVVVDRKTLSFSFSISLVFNIFVYCQEFSLFQI